MIRDDYAGPGGWDAALSWLGRHDVLGVETDRHANATARAAGHTRLTMDVLTIPAGAMGPLDGYVASPPCQTWSAAGKGAGRAHLQHVLDALALVAKGESPEAAVGMVQDDALDIRTVLVLQPLTVIRDERPTWVALEQVPQVLPVWEAYAEVLRGWGYHVAAGLVHAEEHGVAQTRKRAALVAHADRPVALPTPTHTRYVKGKPRQALGLEPWVSMADVLRFGLDDRPSPTITGGGTEAGGAEPIAHLSRWTDGAGWRQRSNYSAGSSHAGTAAERGRTMRDLEEPSLTVTGKGFQWQATHMAPAGTSSTVVDPRPVAEPAATITGKGTAEWGTRPTRASGPRDRDPQGVRVTVQEAAALQSFPAGYPWSGNLGQQYQQVGNAIPPLLARAILAPLIGA